MSDTENQENTVKSMDDTMRETMAGIKARETEAVKTDVPHETAQTPAGDAEPAKTGAERDASTGKFKGKAADSAAPPNTEGPAKEGEAPKTEPAQAVTKAASQAPSSWSPAAKAKWDNLDPTIRAEVLKRESDAQRGIQQSADKVKQFEAINAAVQPHHRQQLTGQYGSFENGIKELLALSDFAGQSPYDFMAYFMQQRGLDPNQLQQILQRAAPQGQQPRLPAQQADNPLLKRLEALEQNITQSRNQTIETTINSFKNQADTAGNLLHPHFDELRGEIASFLDMGKPLQDAYDMAVWASPAHREQMLQQRGEAERQRLETEAVAKKADAEKQAKEARMAANVANVTRPNAGATPTKATSWEDTLKKHQMRLTGTA